MDTLTNDERKKVADDEKELTSFLNIAVVTNIRTEPGWSPPGESRMC